MNTIHFTNEELRALRAQLLSNACNAGCAFEEMSESEKDCDECPFPLLLTSISDKISE